MAHVVIRCPTTGKTISTQLETDAWSFDRLVSLNAPATVDCPACGERHAWTPREAWLLDAPPAAEAGA